MNISEINDIEWKQAIESNNTYCSMLKDLGLSVCSRNTNILKAKIKELGYEIIRRTGRCPNTNPLKVTDEQWIEAIKNNVSYAGVLRDLNLSRFGTNYRMIRSKIEQFNLDTSHMTGQRHNVGENFKPFYKIVPDSEIFIQNSKHTSTNTIRRRLFKGGYKEWKCECCGNVEWQGKPIPLELHHINGVYTDNRLENLQMLCPNCHAQTDNYRGKNKSIKEVVQKI